MPNNYHTEKDIQEVREKHKEELEQYRIEDERRNNESIAYRCHEYRKFNQAAMGFVLGSDVKLDLSDFQKGVEFIERLVRLYVGCHDESDLGVYLYHLEIELYGDPYQTRFDAIDIPVSQETINRLINKSTTDRRAFDKLLMFASNEMKNPNDLVRFPELVTFLRKYLTDQLLPDNKKQHPCPPSERATTPTHARDVAIAYGVRLLEYYGWQASRNISQKINGIKTTVDKCSAKGGTAVDAAGCATNLGYSTVDNIYHRHKDDGLSSPKHQSKKKGRKMR